jgi:hypothetical protein
VYVFDSEQQSGTYGFTPQVSTITFTCAKNVARECKAELAAASELDPIRDKVELFRDSYESAVPFAIATNDSFPSPGDRSAIAKWATMREACLKRQAALLGPPPGATPLQLTTYQQERSFEDASTEKVGELIAALYQQKLTYAEFAKKRYEINHEASDAIRQYRQSMQLADEQRQLQAQELAQERLRDSIAAWSAYLQAVNARTPQTVRLEGTIQVQH